MQSIFNERRQQLSKKKAMSAGMALLRLILFVALTFVVLYPLFTRLAASFMEPQDIHDLSVRYIPKNPTLENYASVWSQLELIKVYPITLLFTGAVSALQMLSSTIVGYGLARFKVRLRGVLLVLALLSLMIPPDLLLIPLFGEFRYVDVFGLVSLINGGQPLSLINTPWPFVILSLTCNGYRCGLYILILCQFFRGVPKELEEAAYIDGAGAGRAFFRVLLPGARTMMITVFLFSFVWTWLDTKFISTLMPDYPLLVTEVGKIASISLNAAANTVQRDLLVNAGVVYLIIPLIILYIFTQRYFVQSIERSGLVG